MSHRLCFVGANLGRHPNWVASQGEILADLFLPSQLYPFDVAVRAKMACRLSLR